MRIAPGRIVTMEYSVALGSGEVVEATSPGAPVQYLHGAGMLLPSLEAALAGAEAGVRRRFVIAAEDAYGARDETRLASLPRRLFAAVEVAPGVRLSARTRQGETIPVAVREVHPDHVVVDMNHPLAGEALHFDVTVTGVRTAGTQEVFSGRPQQVPVV